MEVQRILSDLGKNAPRPVDAKGNLDVPEFNKLPEAREAIAKLKKLGITGDWLRSNGFVLSTMLLYIDEPKIPKIKPGQIKVKRNLKAGTIK